jgi:HEAT repeat protein
LQAARALGRWGSAADVPALEQAASRESDEESTDAETAARAAAGASTMLRPDPDASRAKKALEDLQSKERTTRLFAATSLGGIAWPPSVPALQAAARSDPDEFVRHIAVCALASFDAAAVAPLLPQAEAMVAQDGVGTRCAVKALAVAGGPQRAGQIAVGLRAKDPIARRDTIKALVRLDAAAAHASELSALARSDRDESVRWEAVKALLTVHTPEATGVVVEALGDPSSLVRGAAAHGLARAGDLERTRTALGDPSWETKVSALVGLARRAPSGKDDT